MATGNIEFCDLRSHKIQYISPDLRIINRIGTAPYAMFLIYRSSVSLTTTASCFSEKGFGRKPNLASAGKLRAKASSA